MTSLSFEDIEAAAERLKGVALETPLIENSLLNEKTGGRILLKAETLQHCGSFKFRGAYNLLSQLSAEDRARGVLAWSSGNHAQGVARAAKLLGISARILMPDDAPRSKTDQVKFYGGDVIPYNRYKDVREDIGRTIIEEHGYCLAPPYDHFHTMAGQGVVGLEALAQAKRLDLEFDEFITCCGGGGLTSGIATYLAKYSPKTRICIAEPIDYNDTQLSLEAGKRISVDASIETICDAVATPCPGELTFPIMQRHVAAGYAVTDQEVSAAIAWAYNYLKLVIEPGGAVAFAAVLAGKVDTQGKTIGVTLSGGNIDFGLFSRILDQNP